MVDHQHPKGTTHRKRQCSINNSLLPVRAVATVVCKGVSPLFAVVSFARKAASVALSVASAVSSVAEWGGLPEPAWFGFEFLVVSSR